jgi:DNA processing protein
MSARLTDEQRIAWLRLIRSESIGPRTFQTLVNRHGGAGAALEALPQIARRSGRPGLKIASRDEVEREIEATHRLGGRFVATGEPEYPKAPAGDRFGAAADRGSGRGQGARPPHAGDRRVPQCVRGGDDLHRAAGPRRRRGRLHHRFGARPRHTRGPTAPRLRTGTVAVLAGGLARVYPSDNEPLLEEIIAEGGAALSEMPLEWEPRGRDFPRRNRTVSGLALGVVVVEAARKSGSLITASGEPGTAKTSRPCSSAKRDPRAEGTNDLIRQGAILCGSPEHVLDALAPLIAAGEVPRGSAEDPGSRPHDELDRLWDELDLGNGRGHEGAPGLLYESPPEPIATDETSIVVNLLGPAPVSPDDLARQSGLSIRAVNGILLELEIAGRLVRHAGNGVSLST